MKIGFLITARLKSTRLPKKLLLNVSGSTYIQWLIKRLKLVKTLDEIVVCTSENPQDDPLVELASKEHISAFRGSEEDVILRLYQATIKYDLDYVINMTADCPFVPFDYIDDLVETFLNTNADLVKCHNFVPGFFLSGLKISAMKRLIELKGSNNTEYWLYYFLKTDLFKIIELNVNPKLSRPNYRFILDYPEDHQFLNTIFQHFGKNTYKMSSAALIKYVDQNPELVLINKKCHELALQRTNQDKHSKVIFK
ncbi:NTP transferase domain-containing protein [Verrucomicrobia bacterium]|nr:NTP transferase domain-containing protein [Verrucomicrobiota bacterium]